MRPGGRPRAKSGNIVRVQRRSARIVPAIVLAAAALVLPQVAGSPGPGAPVAAAAPTPPADEYALAGGCYAISSASAGKFVTGTGGSYAATAAQPTGALAFRMQASALGSYVLLGNDGAYAKASSLGTVGSTTTPAAASTFRVHKIAAGVFTLSDGTTGRALAAAPVTGVITLATATTPVAATRFGFAPAAGCATAPEAQVGATGTSFKGASPSADVQGTIDAHTHLTAFEFIGGDFHCGRPWSPLGVTVALPDCASIQGPQGTAAPVQNFVDYGSPEHPHDTVGWPTFKDWPGPTKLSYEGTYYTGIKRAWLAGLRIIVTDLVDNEALCEIMPLKRNPCNDMESVRLQAQGLKDLQDYVDAQSGGPGKGWFRIVTNPFQARKVINEGKLAVVEGAEISHLFDCGETNHVPDCSQAKVDAGLAEFKQLGVSSFYPIHKFDNAFGGTKMDGGSEGVLINGANKLETGHFWDVKTCTGPEQDSTQISPADAGLPSLAGTPLAQLLAAGVPPVYGSPPHCNQQGLTSLGTYLLGQMIKQHFIIEVDHMDAKTGGAALSVIEQHHYSGVISPHNWSSPEQYPRIYNAGGFVNPIAHGSPQAFVEQWKADKKLANPRFHFGFGYGSDMNGLAEQPEPTSLNPISYPFAPFKGSVSFDREQWGQKTFDLNTDGVANYGMYADWLRELQLLGGAPLMTDMFNGAESYLEMWERAQGVPGPACRPATGAFTSTGLGGVQLGASSTTTLMQAGQPSSRPGAAYRYCVTGAPGRTEGVSFRPTGTVALIGSTAPGHTAGGIAPGAPASVLAGHATLLGNGIWTATPASNGARFVYLVQAGTVHAVGLAASTESTAAALTADLTAAGLE